MDINKKRIDETLDKAFQTNQVPAIAAAVLSSDQTLYRGSTKVRFKIKRVFSRNW